MPAHTSQRRTQLAERLLTALKTSHDIVIMSGVRGLIAEGTGVEPAGFTRAPVFKTGWRPHAATFRTRRTQDSNLWDFRPAA